MCVVNRSMTKMVSYVMSLYIAVMLEQIRRVSTDL